VLWAGAAATTDAAKAEDAAEATDATGDRAVEVTISAMSTMAVPTRFKTKRIPTHLSIRCMLRILD